MPRVTTVKKARNGGLQCGKCEAVIHSGDSYLWWQFKNESKSIRCAKPECHPKPSELTRSEFWSTVHGLQESAFQVNAETTLSDLEAKRDTVKEQLEELEDELESRKDNMPEGLQDGATGELLTERADALREAADTLENIDISIDNEEDESTDEDEDEKQQKIQEVADELQEALSSISCS